MLLNFKICDIGDHILSIVDTTTSYLPEDKDERYLQASYQNNIFKYSETATITVLEQVTYKDGNTITYTGIKEHCATLDEVYVTMSKDGLYTVTQMVLPTINWLKENQEIVDEIIEENPEKLFFVTNLKKVYLYVGNGAVEEVTIEYLKDAVLDDTSVSRLLKHTFYIRFLKECYIFYCKSILDQGILKCIEKNMDLKDFTWKRDFIWMTLNAILYYVQDGQLYEAQRLLELINYCGGFCSEVSTTKKLQDCGCSKG